MPDDSPQPGFSTTDMAFQSRFWKIQRVGWVAMALILLLAVAGFFGQGPVSRATANDSATHLSVDYRRFARYGSTTRVKVHARTDGQGLLRLTFDGAYLDCVMLEQITPPPDTVEGEPAGALFSFRTRAPLEVVTVTFDLQPTTIGLLAAHIAQPGGHGLTVHQLIYP